MSDTISGSTYISRAKRSEITGRGAYRKVQAQQKCKSFILNSLEFSVPIDSVGINDIITIDGIL